MLGKTEMPSQLDLFSSQSASGDAHGTTITLPDSSILPNAEIAYYPSFFQEQEAYVLFSELVSGIAWRQDKMKLYGKEVNLPRQTAWYGDPGQNYTFSGITMNPDPWTPALMRIKQKIEPVANVIFNSVLLNHYRNGNDSISWHTDAEPELGKNPIIASVSFGGSRRFMLRHVQDKEMKVEVLLANGSLLIMAGETQHFWQHQIPKTKAQVEPRINLTFRQIKS